jgi:hypothetical protein
MPKAYKAPRMPKAFKMPKLYKAPRMPKAFKMPKAYKAPRMPKAFKMPKLYKAPRMPKAFKMPKAYKAPRMPKAFKMPKAYKAPRMPKAFKMPKVVEVRPTRFRAFLRGPLRPLNECSTCAYTWYPRGKNLSAVCPSCKSRSVFIRPSPSFNLGLFLAVVVLPLAVPFGLVLAAKCQSSSRDAPSRLPIVESAPLQEVEANLPRRLQVIRRCTVWREASGGSVVIRKASAGEVLELVGDETSVWTFREDGTTAYFNKRCAVLLE